MRRLTVEARSYKSSRTRVDHDTTGTRCNESTTIAMRKRAGMPHACKMHCAQSDPPSCVLRCATSLGAASLVAWLPLKQRLEMIANAWQLAHPRRAKASPGRSLSVPSWPSRPHVRHGQGPTAAQLQEIPTDRPGVVSHAYNRAWHGRDANHQLASYTQRSTHMMNEAMARAMTKKTSQDEKGFEITPSPDGPCSHPM